MMMTTGVRKFVLTTHITSSIGWLGSVAAFLALAVAGIAGDETQLVRASYVAMHLITWFVIVPLSIAALATGFVDSLGTPWGLFRHYWVVAKLLLTVLATAVLLVHTQPIDRVAAVATQADLTRMDLWQVRLQLVGDAAAALFVLCAATALSVYKPWGMTAYGLRKQSEAAARWVPSVRQSARPAGRYVIIGIVGFVLLMLALHLLGGGRHRH